MRGSRPAGDETRRGPESALISGHSPSTRPAPSQRVPSRTLTRSGGRGYRHSHPESTRAGGGCPCTAGRLSPGGDRRRGIRIHQSKHNRQTRTIRPGPVCTEVARRAPHGLSRAANRSHRVAPAIGGASGVFGGHRSPVSRELSCKLTPQTMPVRRGALDAGESSVARSNLRAESAALTARECVLTVQSGRCQPSHALFYIRLRTEKQHAVENHWRRASDADL